MNELSADQNMATDVKYPGFTGERYADKFDLRAMPAQPKVLKPGQLPADKVKEFFAKQFKSGYIHFIFTEKQEVYTTPRRVFFKLPGTDVDLCDYMFADEKPNEVKGRVQELMDICVEEDDLDISTERAPTEEDCARLHEEESTEPIEAETTDRRQKGIRYYLIAGIGGVLATAAAALTYMLTENS